MNIAPISVPKTMIPATAATQKVAPRCDLEVVQRGRGAALADDERHRGGERDRRQSERQRALARDRREVDREHERRDEQHREDAAEVVDRIGGLVDVRGNVAAAP